MLETLLAFTNDIFAVKHRSSVVALMLLVYIFGARIIGADIFSPWRTPHRIRLEKLHIPETLKVSVTLGIEKLVGRRFVIKALVDLIVVADISSATERF